MSEKQLSWSQVVESDQVQSKDGRWFTVEMVVPLHGDSYGKVRVRLEGIKKPLVKDLDEKVMVKRDTTGRAVDVFLDVFYSGPAR